MTGCSRPGTDLVIEQRELTGFGDIPIRKMPCRIATIERPAPDVAIVSLQLPANERLQFRAGQFLEFILKDGKRRSYSIATAPHADELIHIHVRHMPGGVFTDQLFGTATPALKERDILRFEGPLGVFFLREDNPKPIVLLASGTGFAPVKAIAQHIFHKRINRDEPDFTQTSARGDPTILKREAETDLLVMDGHTAVIGGIYTRNTGRNLDQVPFFGDIPILGILFQHRRANDQRNELVIFITPRIVNRDIAMMK